MNTFDPETNVSVTSGVVALALVSLVAVTVAVGATFVPLSALTFLFAMVALLLMLVAALLGYQVWCFYHAHYHLDRNALVIRWGNFGEVIPLKEIEKVHAGSDYVDGIRFRRVPLPGWWVGMAYHPELGWMRAYATAPPDEQIIISAKCGNFIISPAQMTPFVEGLRDRLRMGATIAVKYERLLPRLLKQGLLTDRLAFGLIISVIALNLTVFAMSTALYPMLPGEIPVHFDAQGFPDRIGDKVGLFMPALIAVITMVINLGIGLALYQPQAQAGSSPQRSTTSLRRLLSLIVWGGCAAIQAICLLSVVSIALYALNTNPIPSSL